MFEYDDHFVFACLAGLETRQTNSADSKADVRILSAVNAIRIELHSENTIFDYYRL